MSRNWQWTTEDQYDPPGAQIGCGLLVLRVVPFRSSNGTLRWQWSAAVNGYDIGRHLVATEEEAKAIATAYADDIVDSILATAPDAKGGGRGE